MANLIDIGVNLTSSRFSDDLEQVVGRALDAGVIGMLLTGTSVPESEKAHALTLRFPGQCWSTAGVHPHDAANVAPDYLAQLAQLAALPGVKAIGECGLDFNRNFSPQAQQIAVFEAQLQLAATLDMPVFLHERDAFEAQLARLREWPQLQGVAHCFTGDAAQMEAYLDLGLYIGVTGWLCDRKRGEALREAVKVLPLSRLLLETDAPYLTPKDLPGKVRRNEPCYLPHIAQTIAELKNVAIAEVMAHSSQNAKQLFNL